MSSIKIRIRKFAIISDTSTVGTIKWVWHTLRCYRNRFCSFKEVLTPCQLRSKTTIVKNSLEIGSFEKPFDYKRFDFWQDAHSNLKLKTSIQVTAIVTLPNTWRRGVWNRFNKLLFFIRVFKETFHARCAIIQVKWYQSVHKLHKIPSRSWLSFSIRKYRNWRKKNFR